MHNGQRSNQKASSDLTVTEFLKEYVFGGIHCMELAARAVFFQRMEEKECGVSMAENLKEIRPEILVWAVMAAKHEPNC